MSKVVSFTVTINGVEKQIKNLDQLEQTLKAVKKNSKSVDFGTNELKSYQKAQGALVAQQVRHRAEVNRLKNENIDVFIVLAFAQFLGEKVLALPSKGCFNIHTSLLPKYRRLCHTMRSSTFQKIGVSLSSKCWCC